MLRAGCVNVLQANVPVNNMAIANAITAIAATLRLGLDFLPVFVTGD